MSKEGSGSLKKIAVSLLYHNDENYLIPCVESLINSDISNYDFKFFVYDNASAYSWEEIYEINDWSFPQYNCRVIENQGIVNPRIHLFEEIKSQKYDYLLEIHSDMLFPSDWFEELMSIMDEEVFIVQPFIYQPPKDKILTTFDCTKLQIYTKPKKIYHKCRQVHPWLINLKLIERVGGYYDCIFSPHIFEDDDLVLRAFNNGYDIKSTNKSIVIHYGGGSSWSPQTISNFWEGHIQRWQEKHNTEFLPYEKEYQVKRFDIHPVILKEGEDYE